MSCFGCFSNKAKINKKRDEFEAVDRFLVDYAIKYQLYTPPSCSLLRNRLAYVVQWSHLQSQSELIDFKIIPQEGLNGCLMANVGELMNNNSNNNCDHAAVQSHPALSESEDVPRDAKPEADFENQHSSANSVKSEATPTSDRNMQAKTATIDSLAEEPLLEGETKPKPGQIEIRRYQEKQEDGVRSAIEKPEGREMSLFRTEFTNSSSGTQKFTFQTERRTTSSVNVSVSKSYTIGGQLDLSFAIPIETVSLTGEYQVQKSKDESFTKEQVWTVNNEVEVSPGEKAIAEMKVMEERVLATFKIRNTISMKPLSKNIPIYVVKKSELKKHPDDRKILEVFSLKDHNLHKAFLSEEAQNAGIRVNREKNTVEFDSEGVMDMVYQSRQVIEVKVDPTYKSTRVTSGSPVKKQTAPTESKCPVKNGNPLEKPNFIPNMGSWRTAFFDQ